MHDNGGTKLGSRRAISQGVGPGLDRPGDSEVGSLELHGFPGGRHNAPVTNFECDGPADIDCGTRSRLADCD